MELRQVPVKDLLEHPDNIRDNIEVDDELKALAASMQTTGQVQPARGRDVGGKIVLITGHRRLAAAKFAKIKHLDVVVEGVADDLVTTQDDLAMMLAENTHRSNLSVWEEGAAYANLRDDWEMKVSEIAKFVGRSNAHVSRYLKLTLVPAFLHGRWDEAPIDLWVEFANVVKDIPEAALMKLEDQNLQYALLPLIRTVKRKRFMTKAIALCEKHELQWFKDYPDAIKSAPENHRAAVSQEDVDPTKLSEPIDAVLIVVSHDGFLLRRVSWEDRSLEDSEKKELTEEDKVLEDQRAVARSIQQQRRAAWNEYYRTVKVHELLLSFLQEEVEDWSPEAKIEAAQAVCGYTVDDKTEELISEEIGVLFSKRDNLIRVMVWDGNSHRTRFGGVFISISPYPPTIEPLPDEEREKLSITSYDDEKVMTQAQEAGIMKEVDNA